MGSASGSFTITFEELSKVFLLAEDFTLLVSPLLLDETFVLNSSNSSIQLAFDEVTSIGGDDVDYAPKIFLLSQNYPNPFNPVTVIKYALPKASDISLVIYNLRGQEVRRWDILGQPAGNHQVTLDASNIASGVYLYRLIAGDLVQTRKLVLLR